MGERHGLQKGQSRNATTWHIMPEFLELCRGSAGDRFEPDSARTCGSPAVTAVTALDGTRRRSSSSSRDSLKGLTEFAVTRGTRVTAALRLAHGATGAHAAHPRRVPSRRALGDATTCSEVTRRLAWHRASRPTHAPH